jgi:hypothetical protein
MGIVKQRVQALVQHTHISQYRTEASVGVKMIGNTRLNTVLARVAKLEEGFATIFGSTYHHLQRGACRVLPAIQDQAWMVQADAHHALKDHTDQSQQEMILRALHAGQATVQQAQALQDLTHLRVLFAPLATRERAVQVGQWAQTDARLVQAFTDSIGLLVMETPAKHVQLVPS